MVDSTLTVQNSTLTVNAGGYCPLGTGDLILGGGVVNNGAIIFDAAGFSGFCGQTDEILIRSQGGVQRAWVGSGTFDMIDVNVKDQGGTAAITVNDGTDGTGNGANWNVRASPSAAASRALPPGLWSVASTWNPAIVPAICSSVTIRASDIVTLDISTAIANGVLINGTLKFSRVVHSTLTTVGGDVRVGTGGTLDMGERQASPIQASSATLILSSGTYGGQYGLIVSTGGNFTVYGGTKSPAGVALSVSATNSAISRLPAPPDGGWAM